MNKIQNSAPHINNQIRYRFEEQEGDVLFGQINGYFPGLGGPLLSVGFNDKGHLALTAGGQIMGRDEFLRFVHCANSFYESTSDEEIAEMNESRARARARGEVVAGVVLSSRDLPGFVYVIKCDRYYKIGKTKRLSERLGHFATIYPHDLVVVHVGRVANPEATEAELHERFAESRVRGEWFDLCEDDIAYIRDRLPDCVEVSP